MQHLLPRILNILYCIILCHTNEKKLARSPTSNRSGTYMYPSAVSWMRGPNIQRSFPSVSRSTYQYQRSMVKRSIVGTQIHSLEKTIILHRRVSTYISSKRATLSGKAWTAKPRKNVSVGRETKNTIQRKPVSYKQALAVVEPGRA